MPVTALSSFLKFSPNTASSSNSQTFEDATHQHQWFAAESSPDLSGLQLPGTRMQEGTRVGLQPIVAIQGAVQQHKPHKAHIMARQVSPEEGGEEGARFRATVGLQQALVCQRRHMCCLTVLSVFWTWSVAFLPPCQRKGPHREFSLHVRWGWTVSESGKGKPGF